MNKKINKKVVPFLIFAQIMATSGLSYAAPNEIHAFTTMKKWDYHRTNYDTDGNIIYKPKSVQFSTQNEGNVNVDDRIPKLSSKETEYGQNVEVIFDNSTAEAKQWEANIYRVVKQNSDTQNPNSVQDIVYKVEDGKITLYGDSRAIDYNDQHLIKIYSTGYDTIKGFIHIVKEAQIRVHGNYKPIENQDLLFELVDFDYRVTNPVYEVLLDGEPLKGNCKDYHVVSNLIRLENDAHSKLTQGKHKITVKAKGYKDIETEFIVEKGDGSNPNPDIDHNQEIKTFSMPIKIATKNKKVRNIDSISGASREAGKKPDSVSGASGSLDTQANLVFDFDLVSNAQILKELDMETKNSKKVLDIWNSSTKDAASKDGKMLEWGAYTKAAMDAKVKGEYITFEEYMVSPEAKEYKNRPYNVKYVLDNGEYGEAQPFAQIDKKEAPRFNLTNQKLGKDIELSSDYSEWIKNIECIKVGSTQLFDKEYTKENDKIIITGDRFTTGNNNIIIASKGYKDAKTSVLVEKSSINLSIDPDTNTTDQNINVLGVTSDFVTDIKSVRLNGRTLLNQASVGLGNWGYKVQSDKIVLNKDLFKDETKQTLIINSYGYEEKRLQFQLTQGSGVIDPQNDVVPTPKTTLGTLGKEVVITWEKDNPKWRSEITQVKVGGVTVNSSKYSLDAGKITFNDSSVFRQGSNEVVIKAGSYIDLKVNQEIINEVPDFTVTDANTADGIKITVPAAKFGWIDNITEVKVDDQSINKDKYTKGVLSITINKEKVSTVKDYKVEILARGYKKLEVNVAVKDFTKPFTGVKESAITLNASQENKLGKDVEITFTDNQEFRTSIQDIKINDVKVAEDKVKISKGKIVIDKDLFEEAKEYTIKVVAYGYEDSQVSQNIGTDTQKPVGELTPPNLDIDYIKKTQTLIIPASDWTNKINKIKVNDNTLAKDVDYYKDTANSKFVIKGSAFNTLGETTIVFSADGYKDLTLKVVVQNPEKVPNEVRLKGNSTISTGEDVVVDLSAVSSEINGYKVDEVYIGQEKLSGENKVNISDLNVIIKGENFSKPGNYKIILKANGYEDKEFDITVNGQEKPQSNHNAPVLTQDTSDNFFKQDIEITFSDNSGWINKIKDIKINNSSLSSDLSKVNKEAGKLTFPSSLFNAPGTYNIEIIADGFKSATITQEIKKVKPIITTNLSNKTVNSDNFKFTAKATDLVSREKVTTVVKLNNGVVTPKKDTIEYSVTLQKGDNSITIEATDTDGLKSSESYTVKYEIAQNLKNVPSYVDLKELSKLKPGDDIKIKLAGSYDDKAYRDAMQNGSITVDGKDFTAYIIEEIKEGVFSKYFALVLDGSNFDNYATYNITLKAPGYKDKNLQVVIAKKSVPYSVSLLKSQINSDEDVKIKLGSTTYDPEVAYKEALKLGDITVDGQKISNFTIAEEKIGYSNVNCLTINNQYFNQSKQYTVILKAKGYQEKEFKITVNK
ncbi:MAG: DUF1533 domain-containing protein [Tepidibacter sp.]|uniref:hemoblobin-interacting domain-containing protein n=1 Tax=Tepidibacter sp. TaxID=2529387 RepID=UPI0025F0AE8C|nr:hemoblobin-interacting domain-containing protein [Tepidibacter sp.]MCT4509526.1 DUF1533 domain-containing protein [Tepidibacter sp.]